MPSSTPECTPEERVRHYAESFYSVDTDQVRASDFIAEANEVLCEAEKLGKAEWMGGFLVPES